MAKTIKTIVNDSDVSKFIDKVDGEQKRDDSREIVKIMTEVSKEPARMWGTSIIGFGRYHYEYESGRSGEMCLVGFSPRKQNIVLYLQGVVEHFPDEVKKLGNVKTGVGCIYLGKLEDLDTKVLKNLIKKSIDWAKKSSA